MAIIVTGEGIFIEQPIRKPIIIVHYKKKCNLRPVLCPFSRGCKKKLHVVQTGYKKDKK